MRPISLYIVIMLQDIEDESITQMNGHASRVKPLFNPFQQLRERNSSSSLCMQSGPKQCRICLQATDNSDNPLVSPCGCAGTVRFIHDKCFRSWVESSFQRRGKRERECMIKEGIQCELCKSLVGLQFISDYSCCKGKTFNRKFKQNPVAFMLFVALLLLIVACLIFLGLKLGKEDTGFGNDMTGGVVVVVAMVFLGAGAVVIVYLCFVDFLLDKEWILDSYYRGKNKSRPHKMQIIPVDMD